MVLIVEDSFFWIYPFSRSIMRSIEQVRRMVMSRLVADLILEYGVEIGSQ